MIDPTAKIHSAAKIGNNVTVGPFTTINEHVEIGDNTAIDGYCELGVLPFEGDNISPLIIGENSHIRSHSIFYTNSSFKKKLVTGHRVTVREKTIAGENLQIGTLSDLQGDLLIGDYVRMHSNVHIGKYSTIGNFVWIFPYVVLTNDPHPPSEKSKGVTIEDYVAISTMSVVLPGITIEKDSLIGAHSLVSKKVLAGSLYAGNPGKVICEASKMKLQDGSRSPAYPWRRHFHKGYPVDIVNAWKSEFKIV